ncbi:MAG: chemotaxis protein CheW [Acidobacteria bacterium]|nr:chemotaxis protein CheW [Acidobacteriota bacterium]
MRAGAQVYALDASRVVETLTPEDAGVTTTGAPGATVRRGDEELPLVDLTALLTDQTTTPKRADAAAPGGAAPGDGAARDGGDRRRVVIVRRDDGREDEARAGEQVAPRLAAVVVEESAGRRDALVRSLGRHATRWRGVSGAIDLRDGTVALMLDLPRLLGR